MSTQRDPIEVGDLVRALAPSRNTHSAKYRYGTVLTVTRPMKDNHEWTDHKILWHDNGEDTIEWCEELELVSHE